MLPVLTGCAATGDQVRGHDHAIALPSVTARITLRDERPVGRQGWFSFRPDLELGVTRVEGDFADDSNHVHYGTTSAHVAVSPSFRWRNVTLGPCAGLAYCGCEVESGGVTNDESGAGVLAGLEATALFGSVLEPFARYTRSFGGDWDVGRLEVGVGLRVVDEAAIRVGWARQVMDVDGNDLFGPVDGARIESDGVLIGLALRF